MQSVAWRSSLAAALSVVLLSPCQAQPAAQASAVSLRDRNIAPADTRSIIAPALPAPPVPDPSAPRVFLLVARMACVDGRTGETQEALERAETRLLDAGQADPHPAPVDRLADAQRDVTAALGALSVGDRAGTVSAIDLALAALDAPPAATVVVVLPPLRAEQSPAAAIAPAGPPSVTYALLPGHWVLRGARYVWVPPDTALRPVVPAAFVQGAYQWLDGAWRWVPGHLMQP